MWWVGRYGRRASRRVDFFLEPGTKPSAGSRLRLAFEQSPALDGERSFLVVSLNHGPLRSVRLDHRSGTAVELDVALPEGMLQTRNQLVFSVQQTAPDEKAAILVTEQARRLNPKVKIITRCAYTSAGLEATRQGADEVVVGEQVVAQEFSRILQARFPS